MMGVGDEILAAGQAQRWFAEHGVPSLIVDQKQRPRWHPIWEGNPAISKPDGSPTGARDWHHPIVNGPGCRPYIVYPFTAETGWTFNRSFAARDHIAKIYLTPAELAIGQRLRASVGSFVAFDPWSKHENLRWPLEYWTRLVEICPEITFVQQLYPTSPARIAGSYPAQTHSFRDACGLIAAAQAYIRGESGMCHAAAALDVPLVTIWGGCMDWDVLGGYPNQIGVGIQHPPCGSYKPCTHCRAIMQSIKPDVVADALRRALLRAAAPMTTA